MGRARRALRLATEWAATREQFGQQIGKFQGVSFKLADMKTQLDAAELLTLRAAWNDAHGKFDDSEIAMAKVFASEMCQFVTDEAIQIFGGMGLMLVFVVAQALYLSRFIKPEETAPEETP